MLQFKMASSLRWFEIVLLMSWPRMLKIFWRTYRREIHWCRWKMVPMEWQAGDDHLLHVTPDMNMVMATAIMSPGRNPLLAKRDLDQVQRFLSSPRVWQQPLVQSFQDPQRLASPQYLWTSPCQGFEL
jgi:hypothetical protein